MKRIAATLGLTLASTTLASAADLSARVYTKAPIAQVYDWTGFYIGANVGVGVDHSQSALSFEPTSSIGSSSVAGAAGVIGGEQVGYNWQMRDIVFGLEADIQGAALRDNRTCTLMCEVGASNSIDQRIDWFGTARGRIGLATGTVLTYVTGGLAYGHVKTENTLTLPTSLVISSDQIRTGWTLGTGVEAALGGNWTGKVEYLYLDLGTQSGRALLTPATTITSSNDIREHIFRAGVNYHFGEPRVATATTAADWRGLYLGANAGAAIGLSPASRTYNFSGTLPNETYNLAARGFIGGAQVGYNWQASSVVYGLEADIQGLAQHSGDTCLLLCDVTSLYNSQQQRLNWLGTVRGRIGYATGSALFYATGGLAYGGLTTKVTELFPGFTDAYASSAQTKTGYTVGGGIETKFDPFGLFGRSWSAKTEYLYVDLGEANQTYASTIGQATLNRTITSHVQEHIFRTGLNYQFNTANP